MTVKTITVTEDAYEALKALKAPRESFSETILRVSGKRSLREFVGVLSEESAQRLERAVKGIRRRHTEAHKRRMAEIAKAFNRK
jgi:predicted CopG family antitoxin